MFKKFLLLLMASTSLFAGQEQIASANGIEICYETFGSKENPAVLLIMGGCCQSVIWHKAFCERLSDEGFYVIRFDHRDMGLSTCFDFDKDPYDPMDMAKDAIGVLDNAGIKKAHLFGVSLGGLLSEIMAAYFPERVHTITLLGSTCDIRPMNLAYAGLSPEPNALFSPPVPHYVSWMKDFMLLSSQTQEDKLQQRIEGWNRLNGQKYPLDPENNREIHSEFLARLCHPQGIVNHILMLRSPRSEEIVRTTPSLIDVPTVILHGSEDPIFPFDHGAGLSRLIRNAEYIPVEGMGHVPNEHFYQLYIDVLRKQACTVRNRPQEPVPPVPYDEEEVCFVNPSDGVKLVGTLTVPRSKGPHSAVVLLHGSYPFDRNSSAYGHKPFLVWADHLTRQGIAVLRFDKRSAGKSTGNYETSTIQDFAKDAIAAVEYLKTRTEIRSNQIGLIGHSEGGMTASLAASQSDDIAFIVLMAAPCTVNWEELVIAQEEAFQRIDGIDEDLIRKNQLFRQKIFSILKQEKNREIAEIQLQGIYTSYFSYLTPEQRKLYELYYGPVNAQINQCNSAWFRYTLTYDPASALQQVKVPILALNGELDFVVAYEKNLGRIAATLQEAHHPDYTIIQLPKLNHAFQTCKTGSLQEVSRIEETVSPQVLEILTDWIKKRI